MNLENDSPKDEHSIRALNTLRSALVQLRCLMKSGIHPNPKELAWEIRVYEWILEQPDAARKASNYIDMRFCNGMVPLPKRSVIEKLGWDIK